MNCCDSFGQCNQGRLCPARKQPTTHYCEKSRQPCATPHTCGQVCRLIAKSSNDPNTRSKPSGRLRHLSCWALLTVAVMAAAAVTVGFFKH